MAVALDDYELSFEDAKKLDPKPHPFRTAQEAELSYENGLVRLHDYAEYRRPGHEHFLTTVGRIIFNERIDRALNGPDDRRDPRPDRSARPAAPRSWRRCSTAAASWCSCRASGSMPVAPRAAISLIW